MRKKLFATAILAVLAVFSMSACIKATPAEHDHVWDAGEVTTQPTCHSEGQKTYKCTVKGCKQTKIENLSMTPHNWNEGVVTTQPTCTTAGVKTITCQNEGCGITKTVAIDKLEHQYVEGELTKVPDLLVDGERELVCSLCGDKSHEKVAAHADFEEQFGSGINWGYGYLDSFVATQTKLEVKELSKDGDVYKNNNIQIAKGTYSVNGVAVIGYGITQDEYDLQIKAEVEFTTVVDAHLALLDSDGTVKDMKALNSKTFTSNSAMDVERGDILCLVFSNSGTEKAEGELHFTVKAECAHVWDEGTIVKPATCLVEGIYEYTCRICGNKHQEAIAKADHTWNEGEVTTQPTETTEGEKTFTCTVCGETKKESMPKLAHVIANFQDSFSTSESNGWLYGYATDFDWDSNNFTFNHLPNHSDEAWNGVNGLEIKKDWVLTEAEGKDLAVGYTLPDGNEELEVTVSFTAVDAAQGETRLHARVLVVDSKGVTKTCEFISEGTESASWSKTVKVAVEDGDKVYVALFNTGSAGWRQGNLQVVIKGQEGTPFVPSGEPDIPEHDEEGHINLTNKVIKRFDDNGGTLDIACETSIVNDGYGAKVEVTKACSEVWRMGMFINTGVELVAGKTYNVTFSVARDSLTDYEVILQNKQWEETRIDFLDKDHAFGDVNVVVTITEANAGSLWILVQTGNAVNTITISNVKCVETEPVHVHSWDAGEITKPATCTEEGEKTFTCTECGDTKVEKIDMIEHSWNAGEITKPATCTEKGEKTYTCTACGDTRVEDVEALGHSWDAGEVTKPATLEETGIRTYTCTVCGATREEVIPSLTPCETHTWNDGEVTTQPTCHSLGEKTYTCTVCGTTRVEDVEMTAHSYDEGVVTTPATEAVVGVKKYTCQNEGCTHSYEEAIPQLLHKVGDYFKDFSTNGGNGWKYGYIEISEWADDNFQFSFTSLTKQNEQEWGGVSGLIIKNNWLLNEADGKFAAVGYVVPAGNTKLGLNIDFDGTNDETRQHCRVIVADSSGNAKSVHFVGEGQNASDWQKYLEVAVGEGDTVYVSLFNTGDAGWKQGKLQVVVNGYGGLNLTNKIENRFDDAGGTMDIACTSTLSTNGYGAQLDVTKACGDVWRMGTFINTGVTLEAGKTYVVKFHIDRASETNYEVILQNKQWDETRIDFLDKDHAIGDVEVLLTITEANAGILWFLIQGGNAVNTITISNIVIERA